MRLEDKLMADVKAGKEIDIERALLIFSGLETEKEIAEYKLKLDEIDAGFQVYMEANDTPENDQKAVAEALHNYLWKDKTERYNSNYFLTDVIDAQRFLEDKPVGNCVGLTALYTVLGLRYNLDLYILINRKHLLSRLKVNSPLKINVDIENTWKTGFGFAEDDPVAEQGTDGLLAAAVFSRGYAKLKSKNCTGAWRDFDTAEKFSDKFSALYQDRGVAKFSLNFLEEALKDFNRAIQMDNRYAKPFYCRGSAYLGLGELENALKDFKRAAELDPAYAKALKAVISTEMKLGRDMEAIEDYGRLIELEPNNADWHYQRGRLREKAEDTAGALQDYERAVELDPKYDAYFYTV